ncbi:hypothetical protein [Thiorhodococcus fuscus]|uniref:Shikimate kinase n=1 Tax=Thiorhodococcus fuscus TaxID=527200 RepID=A0ABW4Y5U0_9GAMM
MTAESKNLLHHHRTQKSHKIYVMASPCGGKSTFAARGTYREARLVDFNVYFEKWAIDSKLNVAEFSRTTLEEREALYNSVNISYLYAQSDSVCMLGVIGPENIQAHTDISFVIVQPPILRAMKNCLRRKWELKKSNRTSHWSRWKNVRDYRRKLASYAKSHGLPVYPSFEKALDAVLDDR